MSEYSASDAWNTNYNTSNPGKQNNNNKTNSNRVRAVRRSEAPPSDLAVEEVFQAYYDCRKRKRNTANALRFEQHLERNLMDLFYELQAGDYQPGRSICFVVLHPKPREIWAADFRDRIVHHILYNRVADRFYRRFIHDTFACIPGRGTLAAADRLHRHMRSATQNFQKDALYLQADIANFFVSIDKKILDDLLTMQIHHPWTLHLARTLLHHDPVPGAVVRGSPDLLRLIPPHKSLFNANGKGLPIGNLTSQFFANVYLDPIDQFVKRTLKWRRYVRYVDDLCVVDSPDLWDGFMRLDYFARHELKIRFHPHKTHINRVSSGINFVGYVLRPHARYLRRSTVAGAYHRLRDGCDNPRQSLNSYLGMLRHVNGWHQRQRLSMRARAHGFSLNSALTKVISCNT